MQKIKSYSYSLWNNMLEVFIIDEKDNEFILATISDCDNINYYELDNLAQEIIEVNGYYLE